MLANTWLAPDTRSVSAASSRGRMSDSSNANAPAQACFAMRWSRLRTKGWRTLAGAQAMVQGLWIASRLGMTLILDAELAAHGIGMGWPPFLEEILEIGVDAGRQNDGQARILVARGRAVLAGNAASLESQDRAAVGAGRHLHRHLALDGRHGDRSAHRRLLQRHRHLDMDVGAFAL